MELIKPGINLDFVGKRRLAYIVSALLILIGLMALIGRGGPTYGVDFAGGTLVQLRFSAPTDAAAIKQQLQQPDLLPAATVQRFGEDGNEFLVRAQETSSDLEVLSQRIATALEQHYGAGAVEVRRTEMVGPQVGKELRQKGLMAVLYAMIGILVYITWRFELRFAIGAIVALAHDVLITLGAFALTGREIDLPIIAAFLAIIGYSLNDTIIVYDRIRENTGPQSHEPAVFAGLINRSINETLSRTLLTSGTTLIVILALFIFGGGVIHNFAFALLVGVVVGTYSSIFVASPVLLTWQKRAAQRV